MELDWSDPKKLQRRDGGQVLACWIEPQTSIGFEGHWAVTRTPSGDREAMSYRPDGRSGWVQMDRDIIPRPREPRTFDGWVAATLIDGVISHCRVFRYQMPGRVRVRITEVIDE